MPVPSPPRVEVRRAADRARTTGDGRDTAHSFSFGRHYDPANTSHGLLLASNDDVLAAGSGYDPHPHRDLEIVTWVLAGALAHQDSTGRGGVVTPGLAQRLSAGRGVTHSERHAAEEDGPVRFVQMWLAPDRSGGDPSYEQRDVGDALRTGELVPVASGRRGHDAGVRLGNEHAALHAARLGTGGVVRLPDAPYLHLQVVRGSVELEGAGALVTGDAARLTATGGQRVTASEPAEVLVWEMHAGLGP